MFGIPFDSFILLFLYSFILQDYLFNYWIQLNEKFHIILQD